MRGIENFDRFQADKLENQDADFGVDPEKNQDEKANPEKMEHKETKEQVEKHEEQEKQSTEMREKMNTIRTQESAERMYEQSRAQDVLDPNADIWPPDFDDSDLSVKSHIGHTEGGTSTDKSDN